MTDQVIDLKIGCWYRLTIFHDFQTVIGWAK